MSIAIKLLPENDIPNPLSFPGPRIVSVVENQRSLQFSVFFHNSDGLDKPPTLLAAPTARSRLIKDGVDVLSRSAVLTSFAVDPGRSGPKTIREVELNVTDIPDGVYQLAVQFDSIPAFDAAWVVIDRTTIRLATQEEARQQPTVKTIDAKLDNLGKALQGLAQKVAELSRAK